MNTPTLMKAHILVDGESNSRWVDLHRPATVDQAIQVLNFRVNHGQPAERRFKVLAVKTEEVSGV